MCRLFDWTVVPLRIPLILAIVATTAGADPLQRVPTSQDIIKALEPPAIRSLSSKPYGETLADAQFIESLRRKAPRNISTADRSRLDAIAENKPAIDLPMEFEYNSSSLKGEALTVANNLGKALSDPKYQGHTFLLAGHTDGRGSDVFNQKLSERRANAVKQFLIKRYRIQPEKLLAVGYGKTRLKNPGDPNARENRRVQTVNLLPYHTADK